MRDFSCFYLSASGEKRTSSRFSQLDQESCRRHLLAWSRGMHLTYSAVTLEVKFIAEGVVWVAEKVYVWHMENFPVHMRMQSCLQTMTEQVCRPCYLCASLIWWERHRALPLLHIVFPRSQGQHKSALYMNTMITARVFCWSSTDDWMFSFNSGVWGKCPKVLW